MEQGRPKFQAPPVIETALSVQFNPLPGYTSAHGGWFWREYLEKLGDGLSAQWPKAAEAPRIPDQFEKFGKEDVWTAPAIRLQQGAPTRMQFIRSDGERMVQIQDSRFVLNWKKTSALYPSYDSLLPEFRDLLNAFKAFASEAGFGKLAYNQWELAYVDELKKGELWGSIRDLGKIFPGLSMPNVGVSQVPPSGDETMSADWRFSLPNQRGRLLITVRLVRIQPSFEEAVHLTMTTRGRVTETETWEQGMNLGHGVLEETFLAITSAEAQEHWRGKR